MDNQKSMTYLMDMVKQIHETTVSLSQSQKTLVKQYKVLNKKYDALDKKIDTRYDALDAKYNSLNEKIDKHYEENRKEHFEMKTLLAHIQNDIKDLRTDIDTVYDLEKDSREKLRRLF